MFYMLVAESKDEIQVLFYTFTPRFDPTLIPMPSQVEPVITVKTKILSDICEGFGCASVG